MPSKDDAADLEQDEKLQAVLLADHCFGSRVNGGGPSSQPQRHLSVGLEPLSQDEGRHPVLCPLNNVPIIDYILDFLVGNGVAQVIVITASDVLEERLKPKGGGDSGSRNSRIDLQILKDASLSNAGDALRELYKRNWIRSPKMPFLLVMGDVVTNICLQQAMAAHRARHAQDSAAIMTIVLKPVAEGSGAAASSIVPAYSDLCVGLVATTATTTTTTTTTAAAASKDANGKEGGQSGTSASTNDFRIFLYSNDSSNTDVKMPCSFMIQSQSTPGSGHNRDQSMGGLMVRSDLLDTGVAICSLDVLGKFEDEFDYLDVANDFVANSVAEEEEGLQSRIYAHVLQQEQEEGGDGSRSYAARAVDFRTYHAISQDLLRRWAYPLVPDRNLQQALGNQHNEKKLYKLLVDYTTPSSSRRTPLRNGKVSKSTSTSLDTVNKYQYKECLQQSKVARSSLLHGPGMMGSACQVGENCLLERCVLGDKVCVGQGVHMADSHLWDRVMVEDNVSITGSVLASDCVVRRGAVIPRGCVIGQGCVIDIDVHLPEFTRITLVEEEDDGFGDDYESGFGETPQESSGVTTKDGIVTDHHMVGPNGKGRVWRLSTDEKDDESDDDENGDDENDEEPNGDGLGSDLWTQMQSIGGDAQMLYECRRKLESDNTMDDDGLSDNEDDDDFGEEEAFSAYTDGAVTFEDTGAPLMTGPSVVYGRQKGVDVVKEFSDICLDFDDEGSAPMENLAIELNSYKFSQNATYSDATKGATLAVLKKLDITPDMTDGRLVAGLKTKLEFWAPLLQKLSIGSEEEQSIIHALEYAATDGTEVAERLQKGMTFRFLLQTLHDEEVLSEDAILSWSKERKKETGGSRIGKLFRMQPVQEFLEWLEDDDDDDDDDESEEDED